MKREEMLDQVARVLDAMDLTELEERVAPVKCDKNPEAPECQIQPEYGVALYGIEPMYGIEPGGLIDAVRRVAPLGRSRSIPS